MSAGINISEKGQEFADFLNVIRDPTSLFLLALGLVVAFLGLMWAVISAIGDSIHMLTGKLGGGRR